MVKSLVPDFHVQGLPTADSIADDCAEVEKPALRFPTGTTSLTA
jgi:hypothetical protein